jgi:NAD-dependent deacetylase
MKLVVLTGAGISRESGLKTFRDDDGLWAGHPIEEVCTPMALAANPHKVLDFYNMRRREVLGARPNAGHWALSELEKHHDVTIVTQNIDDLHERAGSTKVIHIHGEVFKARSMDNFEIVVPVQEDFHVGDRAPDGAQLRPHICFFHETPYHWLEAEELAVEADIFAVIGTSLNVYPAAGLVDVTKAKTLYVIDPDPPRILSRASQVKIIAEPASTGVPKMLSELAGTL